MVMVIIGVLGYKVYSNNQPPTSHLSPQTQSTTTDIEVKNKITKAVVLPRVENVVAAEVILDIVAESTQNYNKEKNEIGETLQNRSYEDIQNDSSLSVEEKEAMLMDKIIYEEEHNSVPPFTPFSTEEMDKMMLEDFARLQELENKKEIK